MNPDALSRWLRTGGWARHATRLREYIGERGLPCTRKVGTIEVVFHLEGGEVIACVGDLVVATEHRCVVPLHELRARMILESGADSGVVGVRLGRHRERLARLAEERGLTLGAVARTAIVAYLDARGAP